MLSKIMAIVWGKPGSTLTTHELEISDSIRSLKTLTVRDGRVSIDPSEVLTPEYLAQRRDARKYLTR